MYINPFLASKQSHQSTQTSPLDNRRLNQTNSDAANPASSAELADQDASEEDIVLLESMGFQRDRIIEALRISRNDVQRAIAYLLN